MLVIFHSLEVQFWESTSGGLLHQWSGTLAIKSWLKAWNPQGMHAGRQTSHTSNFWYRPNSPTKGSRSSKSQLFFSSIIRHVSGSNSGVWKLCNPLDVIFFSEETHLFVDFTRSDSVRQQLGEIVQTPKFTNNQTRKSTSVADGPMLITETIQGLGRLRLPLISGQQQ